MRDHGESTGCVGLSIKQLMQKPSNAILPGKAAITCKVPKKHLYHVEGLSLCDRDTIRSSTIGVN
jgi:hypothetical protein